MCHAGRNGDVNQSGATPECRIANGHNTVGNGNIGLSAGTIDQRCHILAIQNTVNRAIILVVGIHVHGCHARAIFKCITFDLCNRRRDGDLGQSHALPECTASYGPQIGRQGDLSQSSAPVKRTGTNFGDAVR